MAVAAPVLLASYASDSNTGSSGPIALGSPVDAGTLLAVSCAGGNDTHTFSISDSQGHAWSASPQSVNINNPKSSAQVFYVLVSTAMGAADTVTVDRSNTGGLVVNICSVAGASGAVGDEHANAGTGSTITTANVAADDGSLVFFAGATGAAATVTADNGFTELADVTATGAGSPRSGWAMYREVATAAAITPTATSSSGNGWAATSVEILPSAGGGEDHSGTVSLSGAGTLSTVATVAIAATVALSGAGSLATTGTPAASGTVTLSGAGTLTTTGEATSDGGGTVVLSGTGTLTTDGTPAITGQVQTAGTGTLRTTGVPHLTADVALSGTGALTTQGAPAVTGTITLSGVGTLTTSGVNPSDFRDVTVTVTGPTGHPLTINASAGHPLTATGPDGHPLTLTGPRS